MQEGEKSRPSEGLKDKETKETERREAEGGGEGNPEI